MALNVCYDPTYAEVSIAESLSFYCYEIVATHNIHLPFIVYDTVT